MSIEIKYSKLGLGCYVNAPSSVSVDTVAILINNFVAPIYLVSIDENQDLSVTTEFSEALQLDYSHAIDLKRTRFKDYPQFALVTSCEAL